MNSNMILDRKEKAKSMLETC